MVQGGKFKVPFGLDQLTSESSFDFIYRSRIADQLSPGRDRGVMVHGRNIGYWLNYQLAVFAHDGRNSRTTDPARAAARRTVAARALVVPFATRTTSALADLPIAVDGTTGQVPPGLLSRGPHSRRERCSLAAHFRQRRRATQKICSGGRDRFRPGGDHLRRGRATARRQW